MDSPSFVLALVGDVMPLHPVAAHMADPSSAAVLDLLRSADVAIANCETSGFDPATPGPVPQSEGGGIWLNAGPESLADLRTMGFSMVSRANNHAVDFGIAGMEETDRLLTRFGIVHAGTGATLAAARAPAYLTTRAGRTALISATDTCSNMSIAGHARSDMMGRPGVNPIRVRHKKVVDAATFQALVAALDVARAHDCALGTLSDNACTIWDLGSPILKGAEPEEVFELSARDVEENLQQVRAARARADHVIFSLHTHLPDNRSTVPPRSIRDFARKTIEAGADVFIGHGPHRLRGIEVYHGRPIFYSLGNFICHLHKLEAQPADLYEAAGADPSRSNPDDLLASHGDAALGAPWLWDGVIVRLVHDGATRLLIELHPLDLSPRAHGAQRGTPRIANGDTAFRIVQEIADLSAPFGTEVVCVNGVGLIEYGATPECRQPAQRDVMSTASPSTVTA